MQKLKYFVYKLLIPFVGIVILGCGLIAVSLLLPKDRIHNNVYYSSPIFPSEGAFPYGVPGFPITIADNNTDALMLLIADYRSDDLPVFSQMFLGQYAVYENENSGLIGMDSISDFPSEQIEGVNSYARYWHGWLFPLRLLLCGFNYSGIRIINVFIMICLSVVTMKGMMKANCSFLLFPFGVGMFLLMPITVPLCMAYMISFIIAHLAMIILLYSHRKVENTIGFFSFFMMTGAITAYSEFLQFPLLTLGYPLIIYIVLASKEYGCTKMVRAIVFCSISWFCGYCGMWISKWILASLFTEANVLREALNQIMIRFSSISDMSANIPITRWMALRRNLGLLVRKPIAAAGLCCIAYYVIAFMRNKAPETKISAKQGIAQFVPFLFVAVLPAVWICALANHSYIHHHFTYRVFAITAVSILSGLEFILNGKDAQTERPSSYEEEII